MSRRRFRQRRSAGDCASSARATGARVGDDRPGRRPLRHPARGRASGRAHAQGRPRRLGAGRSGTARLNGEQLYPGDGVAVTEAGALELTGTSEDAEVLLFDMGRAAAGPEAEFASGPCRLSAPASFRRDDKKRCGAGAVAPSLRARDASSWAGSRDEHARATSTLTAADLGPALAPPFFSTALPSLAGTRRVLADPVAMMTTADRVDFVGRIRSRPRRASSGRCCA